jgi:hypothetical protein
MSRPVGHKTNEGSPGSAVEKAQALIQDITDEVNEIKVFLLAIASDVVAFSWNPLFQNDPESRAMVVHVEPVTDVSAVPVDRQFQTFHGIVDHERDELLGKLVRPVVVRTIGDEGREPVSSKIGSCQVIRGCFAGGVGAGGVIGSVLREIPCAPQGAINLVRGNVEKSLSLKGLRGARQPESATGFEEVKGAVDIGSHKGLGAKNAPVHVGFRSKMNHPVDGGNFENALNHFSVADIAFNEAVSFGKTLLHIGQIGEIAGIGEQVEIDHLDVVRAFENMSYKIAADESAAAGDEYVHAGFAF